MAGKQNKTNSVDLVKAKCFFFFCNWNGKWILQDNLIRKIQEWHMINLFQCVICYINFLKGI